MIKANFHYDSEGYDQEYDDDQDYEEGQDYEGDEYYDEDDQEYYEENISDDDYIQTGPKRPNGPKEQNKTQVTKQTTIYNKKVSGFEKRLLTLFKFQKIQILQYLDFRSIHRLYLSCKLIKDTLGQFLWNAMCLKDYQKYLENIKDLPENLPYYLYYSLKTAKSPYELLNEEQYSFKKTSKKLTDIRKFYSTKAFHIHDQIEPNLKELYDINFVIKKYFLSKANETDDFLTFCELSYDLRGKLMLKIAIPKEVSLVYMRYLSGKILQFQVKEPENQDKMMFYYVQFSKLFESYKKNIASLHELSFRKVTVAMHHDTHYYTEEDERIAHFESEVIKDNELLITYKDFETQFNDLLVLDKIDLLCLIDLRRPLLAFIDYTKPALIKLLPLSELRKITWITDMFCENKQIHIEDIAKNKMRLHINKSNGEYSFVKKLVP